jgi:hypothetical protein
MSDAHRPGIGEFFVKTKRGRMVLFTAGLALVCFLVPYACGRKLKADATLPNDAGRKGENDQKDGELPPSPQGIGETLTLGQKYDALISRYGGDLASTKTEVDTTRKELETLRSALKEERGAQEKEKKQLTDYIQQLKEGLGRETGQPAVRKGASSDGNPQERSERTPGAGSGGGGLRSLDLGSPPPKEKKSPERSIRIPTGASGRGVLLNGVFAPLGGEPSPVRLRFDAAIIGPNKARIPLRGAYLIGKAIGDPNSCRVSIQIDKFSTVKETGEAIETKALGYVVGDDGLEGVPGAYEWRAWEFMPLAVTTGGLQGLSGALAQTQTTSSLSPLGGVTTAITGDGMKLAGYQAAGGATNKLGEIVAERMKEIRPAVSTPANRKVTIVFLDGVTLEGFSTQEIDYGKENDPFRGLDTHR